MTAIPLGLSNYVRDLGKTPPLLLKNMYVEKSPDNLVDGLVRLQRPALAPYVVVGAGPITGLFQQPGTFGGDYLVVSANILYRLTVGIATTLGSIGSSSRVSIAASATRALIATGTTCYSTDGTTLVPVVMPGGVGVSSVAWIDNYFVLTQTGSQRFYWLAPGDVDPDPLSFASAENSPDNISCVRALFDELWFPGEGNSTEVWSPTGDIDLPFQRIAGRLYNVGCSNRNAISLVDNTLFFPGTDGKVYKAGQNSPTRISDHSIEEMLRLNYGAGLSSWAFSLDGHSFYLLTIGTAGTFVFDVENANWLHWSTYLKETWRAWIGTDGNAAMIVAGDNATGQLYTLDPKRSNDNGVTIERLIVGGVAVLGKPQRCDNVAAFVSTGWTADVNAEPVMELNFSDDGGMTIDGPWMPMSLGKQGQYGRSCEAWQLGIIQQPGRIFYFRCTADVNLRLSYARMNEL